MPDYNLSLLGLDLSFKTDATSGEVEKARGLIEDRFEKIKQHGRMLSKEKLLVFLALSLADDLLKVTKKSESVEARLGDLLKNIAERNPPS